MELNHIKISENSGVTLSQARSNGLEFTVLDLKDNVFSNITNIFFCKDYFNEFIFAERYKKVAGPQYGYTHKYTGYLENKEYIYLGLSTRKYNGAALQKDNKKSFENLRNFLNLIDAFFIKVNEGKKSDILEVDNNDWRVLVVPIEYTKYLYLFHLYLTFVRIGLFYDKEESLLQFLSNLSTYKYSGIYNEDVMNINNKFDHILAIDRGYIDKEENKHIKYLLSSGSEYFWDLHNASGFVSYATNTNMPYKILFLYGSLREGMYNYDRFKSIYGDEFSRLDNNIYKLHSYDMYSLGSYPVIIPNKDITSFILAEKFIVSNDCYERIRSMELGAGYKEVTYTSPSSKVASVYVMDKVPSTQLELVKDGDWVNFVNKEELV